MGLKILFIISFNLGARCPTMNGRNGLRIKRK